MAQANLPTFSNIRAAFPTTGGSGDDKHIRFTAAKGLYTSPKASTASVQAFFGSSSRMDNRAQKQVQGALVIQQAIAREYPRQATQIMARIGQDHPGIDFQQGITRADLGSIQQSIDAVRADALRAQTLLMATAPTALPMAPMAQNAGRLEGDAQGTFNATAQQATRRYMADSLGDMADAHKHPPVAQPGMPTVIRQFQIDVGRSEIRLGGALLQERGPLDPRQALSGFTGDNQTSFHLSKLVTQQMTTALYVGVRDSLTTAGGDRMGPRLGGPVSGAAKDQFIDVTRHGNDYVIDYRVTDRLNGFTGGGNTLTTDSASSRIDMRMQVRISAQDLAAGNFAGLQVTQAPSYAIHAEADVTSLAQQARDQGM